MTTPIVEWVASSAKSILAWASCISYWTACIGGGCSYVLYIATKDKKYVSFTLASIIVYIMLVASLSVV